MDVYIYIYTKNVTSYKVMFVFAGHHWPIGNPVSFGLRHSTTFKAIMQTLCYLLTMLVEVLGDG